MNLWVAYKTLLHKEVHRILRIWPQTIVPPIITMSLYFVIFGNLIGKRIGSMGGFDYMSYLVPGLVMMSVITNSYGNVVSSFFGAKFGKHIEELMVAPVPPIIILLGYLSGALMRGMTVGTVVLLVSFGFTQIHILHPLITLSVVVLTSLVFGLAGFINAIYAKNFDDITIIPTFILTPMTYLGGVFYSVSVLPEFWQHVSRANPILYMVNAFRFGMLGVSDVPLGFAYGIITVFLFTLGGGCLFLLHKGIGLRS